MTQQRKRHADWSVLQVPAHHTASIASCRQQRAAHYAALVWWMALCSADARLFLCTTVQDYTP